MIITIIIKREAAKREPAESVLQTKQFTYSFPMKKNVRLQAIILSFLSAGILLLSSCEKKDVGLPEIETASTEKPVPESITNQNAATAFLPNKVLGLYSLRGSRTKYRGQANENGDNIILSLDYFGERTVVVSKADKVLTCGYGEPNLTNQGWKYVIHYNTSTKEIILTPNDTMTAAIKPNSFEMLYAVYNPVYHSFTFQTRYTDTDGNENEVLDILNKE